MSRGNRLLELQKIEQDLQGRMGSYKKVQQRLATSSPVEKARKAYERRVEREKNARANQNNMTLELKSLIEKVKEAEEQLYSGIVKKPKELTNLEKELEGIKKRRDELEENMLALIDKIETLSNNANKAKLQYENVQVASSERQDALEKREYALKRYISRIGRTRKKILDEVNAKDLELYRYVQRKKGELLAVAKLAQGVCNACHVEVSAARRDKIERMTSKDKLSTCGNCSRILVS